MSPVRLNGSTSGYTELAAPAVAGNNSIALPTGNGSAYQVVRNGASAGSLEFADKIVSGTAVASTSGTSIDFTGIPSWVKRVTVMFNGVSTNGTSLPQVQIGSGSVSTTGYATTSSITVNVGTSGVIAATTGFQLTNAGSASYVFSGTLVLTLISSNTWVGLGANTVSSSVFNTVAGVSPALGGTLDRVRITTVSGTDTFDAGSINILVE